MKEDREGGSQSLAQHFNNDSEMLSTSGTSDSKKIFTKFDLEMEELRLDAHYNLNWGDIESFHLKEAFKSQRDKVFNYFIENDHNRVCFTENDNNDKLSVHV